MKKVLTGIDIGSDLIKIVVTEVYENHFYTLAATNVHTSGVKKGLITDSLAVIDSLKEGLKEIKEMLGIQITKAIITIPSNDRELSITSGEAEIMGEEQTVTATDILACLQDATTHKVSDDRELVTVIPIAFHIDGAKDGVKNPIGMTGSMLSAKVVIGTVPRENITPIMNIMKQAGIEVVDYVFGETGDYYAARTKELDSKVGAIINIGYDTMKVAVYNKGIMIKNEIVETGARTVDQDMMYMYKINRKTARKIRKEFAVASRKYASESEKITVTNKFGEEVTIDQMELASVIEARLLDLLSLAKKQINILTNREISYIIITGGISEMLGFKYVSTMALKDVASVLNMISMGIRNNIFSSAFGITQYLNDKLSLRGKDYSMVNDVESNELVTPEKKTTTITNESIINKVFGYFFDK